MRRIRSICLFRGAAEQLDAINERFQDRISKIKLLQNRGETGGITEVRRMADIVPLLFAHTAYKSYPESWLAEKKWDRIGRWLDTVSTNRVDPMDTDGIENLDDWLTAPQGAGPLRQLLQWHDRQVRDDGCLAVDLQTSPLHPCCSACLGDGMKPHHDRRVLMLAPVASTPRNIATSKMMVAVQRAGCRAFYYPSPPITIGSITEMVVLQQENRRRDRQTGEIALFRGQAPSGKGDGPAVETGGRCADRQPSHEVPRYGAFRTNV